MEMIFESGLELNGGGDLSSSHNDVVCSMNVFLSSSDVLVSKPVWETLLKVEHQFRYLKRQYDNDARSHFTHQHHADFLDFLLESPSEIYVDESRNHRSWDPKFVVHLERHHIAGRVNHFFKSLVANIIDRSGTVSTS